ncbi:MAG: rhodanese-like domain-containing protein [Sandaracinaceae bacterium]|nr:rhodanese-like domain-containing protein [Sandaracinaceae bacterium]
MTPPTSPTPTSPTPTSERRATEPTRSPLALETARFVAVCASLALLGWAFRAAPTPAQFRTVTACAPPVAAHPDVRWIEQDDARALVESADVVFVDARPILDFETGHVPDAIAMPMDTGVLDPATLPLVQGAATVVAYCDTNDDCAESRHLAGLLAENGVSDVRVLRGGMPLWLSNDYPAESGPCTRCP